MTDEDRVAALDLGSNSCQQLQPKPAKSCVDDLKKTWRE
ncbi:MAG: exopolyphosphatase/pppGpp-phosphohydrolase [Candidatus Azotimanducaceae bacterium]|jgi:exopolyphosphatase/pppGpp-phosphohydrolase